MDRDTLEQRIQTVCLLLLSAVALGFALVWLRPVMIPFVLSLFIAVAFHGLVRLGMERLRLPYPSALFLTLLVAAVSLFLLGGLVTLSASRLAAQASTYQQQLASLTEQLAQAVPLDRLGLDQSGIRGRLAEIPAASVGNLVADTTSAILDILSQSVLVLIFVLFLLVGGPRPRATGTRGDIESRIQRYLVTKALVSVATGVLVGLTLMLLGVPLAVVFGLFAFLLNFIPSVGSIIATLLPLPVVVVTPEIPFTTAVLAILLPGALQMTVGNFIEPAVMGESLDLHPVTILIMLIVWGMLWGIVGMLLATPITAVLKILFEKLEPTRPLAHAMAGRFSWSTQSVPPGG